VHSLERLSKEAAKTKANRRHFRRRPLHEQEGIVNRWHRSQLQQEESLQLATFNVKITLVFVL
jgi:hypothetical protein